MWPLIFFFVYCAVVDLSLAGFDPTTHKNWKLLENRNCDSQPTSRIVGGQNAALGEFPWMAGLVYRNKDGSQGRYLCSGAILNKNTIITSAACVAKLPDLVEQLLFVIIGSFDKTKNTDCDDNICAPLRQVRFLKEIIYHKEFDAAKKLNDIALLRVGKDIKFNSHVWPICTLRGDLTTSTFQDDEAVVAGWGETDTTTKEHSNTLVKVTLKVRDPSVCKTLNDANFDPEKQMCVGGEKDGPGPCFGDEGGPLMIVRDGKTYLTGIFSYSGVNGEEKCGALGNPPVFVRVSAYLEWIMDNLNESEKDYQNISVYECDINEQRCKDLVFLLI